MIKNVLIIDDHPTQIEGYKAILSLSGEDLSFTTALNCEQAFHIIHDTSKSITIDLVMLDWSLPEYPEGKLFNGEDIGLLVRKKMPRAKIMMLTSHFKSFTLLQLYKSLSPEGLLVKSDFGGQELLDAFKALSSGEKYFTVSVHQSIRQMGYKGEELDAKDRNIILLLSQGVKTKSIPERLRLSQSSVEKRKVLIKDYLGIEKGSDEDIVEEARRKGYI